jgi:zinc transporter 9
MALLGNTLVTIAKFVAAYLSGSSVMFSEAVHSIADTVNQVLLLVGLQRSLKAPDDDFEYGYGNERFFWAILSACGIFFVGAGVTVYRGLHTLLDPHPIEFDAIVATVLALSFCIEAYTLVVALMSVRRSLPNVSWRTRIALADTASLAVILEDSIAVLGIVVAALSLALSYATGNPAWDAAGSVVIGVLLGVVAVILIMKNRAFLLGRAMPEELQTQVLALIQNDPDVKRIIDFKSVVLGTDVYRIKFEIEFQPAGLLRMLEGEEAAREEFREVQNDYEAFRLLQGQYAERLQRVMGKKIDELEQKVKTRYPSIRHIDIEVN